MNIEYFYKPHIDLIYHILAHIKVNNASDLYSSTYVKKMAKLQRNATLVVPDKLIEYYNQNFDKLGIINFIPFFATVLRVSRSQFALLISSNQKILIVS